MVFLMSGVRHAFTVDVEDWYHGIPGRGESNVYLPRLERGLEVLLQLLDRRSVKATFFWLGELVARHPDWLLRIASSGHEIGCHGWSHEFIYKMSPQRFREETLRARDAIGNVIGRAVEGYRAPYFSITKNSWWALEILSELGFTYDSSIMPIRNWRYGLPAFGQHPQAVETKSGRLWEIPISVRRCLGFKVPVSGGAYFRLYPYAFTRANIRAHEGVLGPAVFYLHPWELDPEQPRVGFSWKEWCTHYVNLSSTQPKLERLLGDFAFGTLREMIASRTAV